MSDMFEKAWYDHTNPYTRHRSEDFLDSVRQPGTTGPSGMDRARFVEPDRYYYQKKPDFETGWKNDDLPLKIARLSLEQNKQLDPKQLLELAESKEDIKWMADKGYIPSLFTDSEAGKQSMTDLKSGAKTMEDIVRESLADGYKPAGTYDSGYFMPDNTMGGMDLMDKMRAVINARLMDVPVKQLRQLVDDNKTSAPKLMENWHESTKPYGAFSSGEWEGYTPISRGAKATPSKNLTGLGVESPIFRDILARIGKKNPEVSNSFRRLLTAEASDLLNTMDERRELDTLNEGKFGGRTIGPQEDMGDIKIREEPRRGYGGQDNVRGPFEEDFQIMNRSNDSFEDAWSVVKDFYFAPDNPNGGVFFPDELPFPDEEIDVSPFASDQLKMGKNLKMINMIDENYTYPFPTPKEPFQRGSSKIKRPNTPTGTVGVNLGDIGSRHMREGFDENKIIDSINEILSHEHGHSAIHNLPLSRDEDENVATFIGEGGL